MVFAIKVNGKPHSVDVDGDTPLALGAARRARHDRHEVRLRHGAVRRLHRAYRRRPHAVLRHADRQRRQFRRSPRSRRSARRPRAPGSRRRGSTWRSSNAATASRARSCPRRRCSRAIRIRPIPTSTTQCPATSAAAGPMSAFARRSSGPRRRPNWESGNDPRSLLFPPRRPAPIRGYDRSLPAQVPAGRSGRRRRPAAEPELAVRRRAPPKLPKPAASPPTPSSASTATGGSS